jgi:hypothetical protein
MSGVLTRDGSPVVVAIVFRHLSPAAFSKRLVLSVDLTLSCCGHGWKTCAHSHLGGLATIEWE